jgi:GTP-binding protein
LDEITLLLPKTQISRTPDTSIKIALIGKPNVGKSSIFNYWVGSKRVVVSEVPGTTRTAIDTKITQDHQDFTLIDTAGLRRKAQRQAQPDVFSGFQTYRSIRKSDVSLLILDSTTEITKQDQSLAREIFDQQKGCIILANKTDLTGDVKSQMHAYISSNFPFLWMCPVFFVSAKSGLGLAEVLPAVVKIFKDRNKTIPQPELDKLLAAKLEVDPPRRLKDQKAPKVLGLQQIGTNPPIFELLVNHPPAINDSFRKSMIKTIIKELDMWGTPIKVLTVKKVGETKHEIERS